MTETYLCYTQESLPEIARDILAKVKDCRIYALTGNLGAGKTALIRELCGVLHCQEEVTSPTFSVINEYLLPKSTIYHMDLYRLNNLEEALDIGIEDYLLSGHFCFIEWPELIFPLLMNAHCRIHISLTSDQSRKIEVEWISETQI